MKTTVDTKQQRNEMKKHNTKPEGEMKAEPKKLASSNAKVAGLCASCSEKDRCAFASADGGVWHCEGYTEIDKNLA